MSNNQTPMKPSVCHQCDGVYQPSAKLIETVATNNDDMEQSVETVNNPKDMEKTNTNGLFEN